MKNIFFILVFSFLSFSLLSQCSGLHTILHSHKLGTPIIGEPEMDAFFNVTKPKLESFFGVKADVYFFQEENGPKIMNLCSSLSPDSYNGTIRIGLGLLKNELWVESNGVYMTTALLAHEYAHLFQCRINGALRSWKRELQADFLAGYFLGRKSYNYEEQLDIQSFATVLFEGDWFNPFHHGTAEERAQALIDGYHNADLSLEEVYIKSLYDFNSYERIDPTKKVLETCDFCYGLGKTVRPSECPVCIGDGKRDCNICDSKGEFFVFGKMHSCKSCEGKGHKTCHFCAGHKLHIGAKLCPKCNGNGKVDRNKIEKSENRP